MAKSQRSEIKRIALLLKNEYPEVETKDVWYQLKTIEQAITFLVFSNEKLMHGITGLRKDKSVLSSGMLEREQALLQQAEKINKLSRDLRIALSAYSKCKQDFETLRQFYLDCENELMKERGIKI